MLADAGANIQSRNNTTGWVPLHDAAKNGNFDAVKQLLDLGAPHLPRTTFGELPVDFAKEQDHTKVVAFLENYTPPPATVYKFQWYHGTLDRNESNKILKQYASSMGFKDNYSNKTDPDASAEDENTNSDTEKFLVSFTIGNVIHYFSLIAEFFMLQESSGTFLVRFSENSGDYVLTLLYNNNPKHFIIQKYVSSTIREDIHNV